MSTVIDIKKQSDLEIVEAIVTTRNTLLFGELYDRYITLVYNKCRGFAKSEAEAEDLTQDVFIHVFQKLHTFKTNDSFKKWIYVVTYNFCVNYVNRNTHKKIEKKSVELNDSNELLIESDISDQKLFELKFKKLEKALELIPPNEKVLLLLKYQDDLSINDLMNYFELGESAVKMRLKRSKSKLIEVYNTL